MSLHSLLRATNAKCYISLYDLQFSGMRTIPEEGDRFYGPFAGLSAARMRPASALSGYQATGGHPVHHTGSAEPFFVHNTFDNANNNSAFPGFGASYNSNVPLSHSGPPATASPMDVAMTGCPPHPSTMHGGTRSAHGMHLDAAQPVALAPDDHSWSLARNSSMSAPPTQQAMFGGRNAGRTHTHSHNTRANALAHANAGQHVASTADIARKLPPNAQALFWQPSPQQAFNGSNFSGMWAVSSPSSTMSQQAPSPPDPPPGYLISSTKGSRHLLALVKAAEAVPVSGVLF